MARIPLHHVDPHPPLPAHKRRRRGGGPLLLALLAALGLFAVTGGLGAQAKGGAPDGPAVRLAPSEPTAI